MKECGVDFEKARDTRNGHSPSAFQKELVKEFNQMATNLVERLSNTLIQEAHEAVKKQNANQTDLVVLETKVQEFFDQQAINGIGKAEDQSAKPKEKPSQSLITRAMNRIVNRLSPVVETISPVSQAPSTSMVVTTQASRQSQGQQVGVSKLQESQKAKLRHKSKLPS